MKENAINYIKKLIKKGYICPYSTPDGNSYIDVKADGKLLRQYELNDKGLTMAIRELFEKEGMTIPASQYSELCSELEFEAYKNRLPYNLSKRCAFLKETETYLYDLDADKGLAIGIDKEGILEMDTPEKTFLRTKTYERQVLPDWEVDGSELPFLLKRHMNIEDEELLLLMAVYLVCAFLACIINVPILIVVGEKGSSKTTILRRVEKIIDPKTTDLGGAPRSVHDMEIRLNNNYFCAFDNLSSRAISRNASDMLCRAVSGGTTTHRKLYSDSDEVVFNLKNVIALNGITSMVHESDLADRVLFFPVQRLDKKAILTEQELNDNFEADRPAIEGCIFRLLSEVLADDEPVKIKEKTRLADFFEYAVKVGRAMGYEDTVVADLLWKNQRLVNEQSLAENPVALCVLEHMKDRTEYKASVSELLGELKNVAERNNINLSLLPSQPNVLSRRLNEIKSNLEGKNLYYDIRNIGSFRQIHIWKKHRTKKRK